MSAVKKPIYTPGESTMEQNTKRFNKRALIGSFIIHLFFFLIRNSVLNYIDEYFVVLLIGLNYSAFVIYLYNILIRKGR